MHGSFNAVLSAVRDAFGDGGRSMREVGLASESFDAVLSAGNDAAVVDSSSRRDIDLAVESDAEPTIDVIDL